MSNFNSESKVCKTCLLYEGLQNVHIESNGNCNICNTYRPFKPIGEDVLLTKFEKAKKKNAPFDALVPISGGKDSAYILFLATKVYGLNVLTYTYDNGLMSDLAIENIRNLVKAAACQHEMISPSRDIQKRCYQQSFVLSGDICGVCGIGIMQSTQMIAKKYQIPLILLGHSPMEDGSFSGEDLYDIKRQKSILAKGGIKPSQFTELLFNQSTNYWSTFIDSKWHAYGEKVNLLYYLPLISDKEIAEVLKREMLWQDVKNDSFTKHFDCVAEPLTNFIRQKRIGQSRRIFQLSNMIRVGELTRSEAEGILNSNPKNESIEAFNEAFDQIGIHAQDVELAAKVPMGKWEAHRSKRNRLFAYIRKKITHS